MRSRSLSTLLTCLVVSAPLALTACTGDATPEDKQVVAVLLAGGPGARWAEVDQPVITEELEAQCPDCTVIVETGDGSAQTQARQFTDALDEGADVVVLHAADSEAAEQLVVDAGDVPIVAYDRFVPGADYFVGFDATVVGRQLAKAALGVAGQRPSVLVVNGPRTDANAVAIKGAVGRELKRAKADVVAELDPEDWSGEAAGRWVAGRWSRRPVDVVLTASDTQAEGVAQALRRAKVPAGDWPVIAGQDAELDALRRIINGQQAVTVYKPFHDEAAWAADAAAALVTGDTPDLGEEPAEVEGVDAMLFTSQPVDLRSLTNVVVRSGRYTPEELCAPTWVAKRCTEVGIR